LDWRDTPRKKEYLQVMLESFTLSILMKNLGWNIPETVGESLTLNNGGLDV
jgi:hypothetical protein